MSPKAPSGDSLTARELEVARLLPSGLSIKEIAARLGMEYRTARNHLGAVYAKTGLHNQAAVALAVERGELGNEPQRRIVLPGNGKLEDVRIHDILELSLKGKRLTLWVLAVEQEGS